MGAEGGFCLRLDSPRTAAGRNLAAHVPVTLGPSHALWTTPVTASLSRVGLTSSIRIGSSPRCN